VDLALRMAGGLRDHLCGLQLMRARSTIGICMLLPLILAFVFVGLAVPATVQAADCPNAASCDQGKAFSMCRAAIDRTMERYRRENPPNVQPVIAENCIDYTGRIACAVRETANGGSVRCWNADGTNENSFYYGQRCEQRQPNSATSIWSQLRGPGGSVGCMDGCNVYHSWNVDGTFENNFGIGGTCDKKPDCSKVGGTLNQITWTCDSPEPKCPDGAKPNSLGKCGPEPCPEGKVQQPDGTCKSKENECPAGTVKSPDGKCLPGDGQCASGEVRGADGTCKRDSDGDGKPDPVTDESFSGGDNCASPPACSGSPIMCGQARIQWRIDCNTRKNRNIAGGACSVMPVCTGEKCDAMEYAGLLMQWRSTCALEKMASSTGTGGGDNPDVKAIRDALTGTGGTVTTAPDRPSSDVWTPNSGQPTRPDASGYGWGRGCPQPPAIEVMGRTIAFDTTPLCRWLGLGSYFVVGLAALFCLRIIASKDA